MKFVLKTKDYRWVYRAEQTPKPGYTNIKDVNYELTGVIREAKTFSEKEANKWVSRLAKVGVEVTMEAV